MEGFENVVITLDSPNESYYPGQFISGHIEFKLTGPEDFLAILVQFMGEAEVEWEERNHELNTDYEKYFDFTQTVFGGNAMQAASLPPGTHKFPFQYQIPFTAPSTFEGVRGKVWYRILTHADVPNKERVTAEKEFTVIAILDLNKEESLMKTPIEMNFEEVNYSCFCSNMEAFQIDVRAPQSGYCPGQLIPLHVTVEDNSSIEVKKMEFALTSRESFYIRRPQCEIQDPDRVLAAVKRGPVLTNTKKEFTVELRVPDMIAPNLDACDIMGVDYYIKVKIKLTGCNRTKSSEADIYIGSIPLAGTDDSYEHPCKESLPIGPIPVPPNAPPVENPPGEQPYQTTSYVPSLTPSNYMAYSALTPTNYAPNPMPMPMNSSQASMLTNFSQAPYIPPEQPALPYPLPNPALQGSPYGYPSQYPQPSSQNNSYYNPAATQVNWQWNGSSNSQVGHMAAPSAPPPQ